MSTKFQGKRVLVTGASKGLGHVVAKAFADQGATVLAAGRTEDKLQALLAEMPDSAKHAYFVGDLAEDGEAEKLVTQAKEQLGGIDIIFHAMGGGYGFRDPLLSMHQFTLLHKVNVGAGAEINRHAIPLMQAQGWGRVIHVGSVASTDAIASVGYNTVKAALAAYVRSMGRNFAGDNVVVTAINPGAFYAPGNSWRRLDENNPDVVKTFIEERLPRKKIAAAEEMLPLIFLLASDDAAMMAGTSIAIDAGEGVAYNQE